MSATALIVEPSAVVLGALRKAAEAAGLEVKGAQTAEEALTALEQSPPTLLIATQLGVDGEAICREARKRLPECPVVLVYPPDETSPDARAAQAGADACLMGPLKHGTVVSCLRSMLRIRDLKEKVEKLERDLRDKVSGPVLSGTRGTGNSDFDFFKKTLLMEVKRSRRYRYPVAFLLVGVDQFREAASSRDASELRTLMAGALTVISEAIRDIDLAVPFTDGRFLAFLPHTHREGSAVVAGRLVERLQKRLDGLTVSVGIASYEPSKAARDPGRNAPQISFGSLMKEATEALGKAQMAGGNRVEFGTDAKPRRSRISMG